jgi:hypothetical protein
MAMSFLKDQVLLLVAGIVCAGLAALYFNFLGENAFTLLLEIALVAFVVDGIAMRRKLKQSEKERAAVPPSSEPTVAEPSEGGNH